MERPVHHLLVNFLSNTVAPHNLFIQERLALVLWFHPSHHSERQQHPKVARKQQEPRHYPRHEEQRVRQSISVQQLHHPRIQSTRERHRRAVCPGYK